jgi:GNAT superfamily N-acetyltransferase
MIGMQTIRNPGTRFTIRRATAADAPGFAAIEQSAGDLFRTVAHLAWIADSENLADPHYAELIEHRTSWVAQGGDGQLIGFLCAEIMGEDLHLHELAVALDWQRRGIGRELLGIAIACAAGRGLAGVTLTTFRALGWNEPFYAGLGFETLAEDRIGPRLAAIMQFETARGLPAELRCAMRKQL